MQVLPVLTNDPITVCCAPASTKFAEADATRLADLFKALGDPVRLKLFADIASQPGEVCVCDISDVGVSQPTVSHHLKRLREAGLLTCERRGTWVYYRAVPEALDTLSAALAFRSLDTPQVATT